MSTDVDSAIEYYASRPRKYIDRRDSKLKRFLKYYDKFQLMKVKNKRSKPSVANCFICVVRMTRFWTISMINVDDVMAHSK